MSTPIDTVQPDYSAFHPDNFYLKKKSGSDKSILKMGSATQLEKISQAVRSRLSGSSYIHAGYAVQDIKARVESWNQAHQKEGEAITRENFAKKLADLNIEIDPNAREEDLPAFAAYINTLANTIFRVPKKSDEKPSS